MTTTHKPYLREVRSEEWPSRVLNAIAPRMDADGLDRRRLGALAGFIATLPMQNLRGHEQRGYSALNRVEGRMAPTHYRLRGGGMAGFGYLRFAGPNRIEAYALTGYGLVCWGWGIGAGMSAVARNGRVSALQDVLTAEPVMGHEGDKVAFGAQVGTHHVADALREFLDCLDPRTAWEKVAAWHSRIPVAASRIPVGAPEPAPVALPAVRLPGDGLAAEQAAVREAEAQVAAAAAALDAARRALLAKRILRGDDPREATAEVYGEEGRDE